jgi:hypothetical protein
VLADVLVVLGVVVVVALVAVLEAVDGEVVAVDPDVDVPVVAVDPDVDVPLVAVVTDEEWAVVPEATTRPRATAAAEAATPMATVARRTRATARSRERAAEYVSVWLFRGRGAIADLSLWGGGPTELRPPRFRCSMGPSQRTDSRVSITSAVR